MQFHVASPSLKRNKRGTSTLLWGLLQWSSGCSSSSPIITSYPVCTALACPPAWQAVQSFDDGASSQSGSRKSGFALSAARAWRKLVGEATDEVRWLPTGCLQLLDTLQEVSWGGCREPYLYAGPGTNVPCCGLL